MASIIVEMFSYAFIVRAVWVGALIALSAALLGVPLVLKRYAMIGDGLSHVGFAALSIAAAMNLAPLYVALPVVTVFAFLLLRMNANGKLKGDSAIALLSTSALAIGVIVTSLTTGMNVDVYSYMFGSILAMTAGDVYLTVGLSAAVLVLFLVFYHQIFAVTFDESFARATGTRAGFYNAVLAILTALTIVVGMRMMGTLLISSLVIFPALTAMRVYKRFFSVVCASACVAVACFLTGIVASYALNIPAGASVVAVNLLAFALFAGIGYLRQR